MGGTLEETAGQAGIPGPRARSAEAAADPADAYRLEESLGHLLRRAHQRHVSLFQEHAGAAGLTPTQFATLLRLQELGRASQNALGRAVALDSATIQGVVQRLAGRGLIVASRDPMDRRVVVLELTPEGSTLLAAARTAAVRTNDALLAPLPANERAQLLLLLRRLLG
jgi:DNA-binding MarR family transcriptional regulator